MNNEKLEIILSGNLETEQLTDSEKEIALKILNNLEGTLVIRAKLILQFCQKAIHYYKINSQA